MAGRCKINYFIHSWHSYVSRQSCSYFMSKMHFRNGVGAYDVGAAAHHSISCKLLCQVTLCTGSTTLLSDAVKWVDLHEHTHEEQNLHVWVCRRARSRHLRTIATFTLEGVRQAHTCICIQVLYLYYLPSRPVLVPSPLCRVPFFSADKIRALE